MSQMEIFRESDFLVCHAERIEALCPQIKECSIKNAEGFIQAHYLHTRPAIVRLCLMLWVHSKPAGICVFSEPPPETQKRYGGITWELGRLYLKEEMPPNSESWLISRSVRWVKRNHPHVHALVSYADPSAGHSGTIYRACGWTSDGMTDDERITPRNDYVNPLNGQKFSRRCHAPVGMELERRPRISKHRFVLIL